MPSDTEPTLPGMKLKLVVGGVVCRWNIVNVEEATGLCKKKSECDGKQGLISKDIRLSRKEANNYE